MADHKDDELLYTLVFSLRTWGKWRLLDTLKKVAKDIEDGQIPYYPGLTVEFDPGGGGGPYNEARNRKFEFRMDGYGLPGYPGEYPE